MVHEYIEDAAGEAWDGGPVILSWEDAQLSDGGFNVVIHEFAHKLDLQAGDADGMPSLAAHPDIAPRAGAACWKTAGTLHRGAGRGRSSHPARRGSRKRGGRRPVWPVADGPYAATDEAEFFAVSSEHFFVDPWPMRDALPEWYAMLRAYYRQDPAERLA